MPTIRVTEHGRPFARLGPGLRRGLNDAAWCAARIVVAVVDDRPVALVVPASRRVVLDRLGKLLGADHVRLARRDEVGRFLSDRPTGAARSMPAPPGVPLLMDASLLSARALEIRPCGDEASVRLPLEDWLATARPALGFFSEPDGGQDA